MDKEAYEAKSKEFGLPCKCPLVGYCGRWAVTEYIHMNSTWDSQANLSHAVNWLSDEDRLPKDYHEKQIDIARHSMPTPSLEHLDGSSDSVMSLRMSNACPEAMLEISGVAATHADIPDWFNLDEDTVCDPAKNVRSYHFSECLEFIQSPIGRQYCAAGKKTLRTAIPPSVRFAVLKRDNFECAYCGAKRSEGARLEADHKISVKDGGTNEIDNLVCACITCNRGKGADSVG